MVVSYGSFVFVGCAAALNWEGVDNELVRENRIDVTIATKKMMMKNSVMMTLEFQDVEICKDRQIAVCHIRGEKVGGDNFAGKIAAGILSVAVSDIVQKAVSSKDIADIASFSKDTRLLVVDLSKLEPIRKLAEPIGLLNIGLLDAVGIRVFHRDGGLAASARLNSNLHQVIESMTDAKNTARGWLSRSLAGKEDAR
jgi:hypothetical protein